MKIYDVNVTGGAAETGRTQETKRSTREGSASTGAAADRGRDRVELSSTLSSLGRALATYGSARADKVQALASQYRSGAYQADSLATSRAMVAGALSTEGGS